MAEKIAAVATGHARTGIGILRLSGDGCIEAAGQVFHLQSGKPLPREILPTRLVVRSSCGAPRQGRE